MIRMIKAMAKQYSCFLLINSLFIFSRPMIQSMIMNGIAGSKYRPSVSLIFIQ